MTANQYHSSYFGYISEWDLLNETWGDFPRLTGEAWLSNLSQQLHLSLSWEAQSLGRYWEIDNMISFMLIQWILFQRVMSFLSWNLKAHSFVHRCKSINIYWVLLYNEHCWGPEYQAVSQTWSRVFCCVTTNHHPGYTLYCHPLAQVIHSSHH